jgi:hypothetical protein
MYDDEPEPFPWWTIPVFIIGMLVFFLVRR